MKKWLLAVLFIAVLTLAACGGGDDDGASDDPVDTDNGTEESADHGDGDAVDTAAGEDVYQQNCAMCHGADLTGGAGDDLTSVGSKYSPEEIEDIIVNGTGSMQPQNVDGEDLDALVGWLSEQQ